MLEMFETATNQSLVVELDKMFQETGAFTVSKCDSQSVFHESKSFNINGKAL